MNPYRKFVTECVRLIDQAKTYPLGEFPPAARPEISPNARKALFFAPHPDDECIVGGLALRLFREARMNVINVAVTQGSKKERQADRLRELKKACDYLGFGLVTTGPHGLERVNPRTLHDDPAHWAAGVKVIAEILSAHKPKVILFPHEHDWNSTHIGTHFLVMDALKNLPQEFECYLVETEFWGQNDEPNLMAEISEENLADLITGTTFHVGEIKRNPYHLLLPAWMMDNVRRGTELVGGQGGAAPDFLFAAIYRLRKWTQHRVQDILLKGRMLSAAENPAELFP
jgi:N-acetylglucosamine malate deacetylase 1